MEQNYRHYVGETQNGTVNIMTVKHKAISTRENNKRRMQLETLTEQLQQNVNDYNNNNDNNQATVVVAQ